MNKNLGRLDLREIKSHEDAIAKIFKLLDDGKVEQARTHMVKLLSTPNYFIREFVGKKLTEYHDVEVMDKVVLTLLGHKIYGVRAATIFYYYLKYYKSPRKLLSLMGMSWSDTPWETEQILYEMWQKYPAVMKKEMIFWAESPFEKQRMLAYHGIEAIANADPVFITTMIEKNLDDECVEVQKKITNVLTHAVRVSPAECYSFIREWLSKPSEARKRTLYIAMRKLVSMALNSQGNGKSSKNDEFYLLTMQSIKDWKADPDEAISSIGEKLVSFSKNPQYSDSDNL